MEGSEHLESVLVVLLVGVGDLVAELAAIQLMAYERKLHFESLVFSRDYLYLWRELKKQIY